MKVKNNEPIEINYVEPIEIKKEIINEKKENLCEKCKYIESFCMCK